MISRLIIECFVRELLSIGMSSSKASVRSTKFNPTHHRINTGQGQGTRPRWQEWSGFTLLRETLFLFEGIDSSSIRVLLCALNQEMKRIPMRIARTSVVLIITQNLIVRCGICCLPSPPVRIIRSCMQSFTHQTVTSNVIIGSSTRPVRPYLSLVQAAQRLQQVTQVTPNTVQVLKNAFNE